jgi:hypothetical protein
MKIAGFLSALVGATYFCGHASAYPAPYTCSRNFYVATTGSDSAGCGTSQANACASIQGANNNIALQGGDCVNVAAGTYSTNYTIDLRKGGNANTASGYVAYVGAPNHGTIISWTGSPFYGLRYGVPYLILDGFDFNGNFAPTDALMTTDFLGPNVNTPVHHFMLLNNIIRNSNGGGWGTAGGDYFIVAGNIIHDVSRCTQYGESGIHILWPNAIPGFSSSLPWDTQYYHIQYIDNISHDNGWNGNPNSCPTNDDGNGLNADNFQLQNWPTTPGSPPNPGPYPYHTLFAGNLTYNNSSRGINANSANNIDFYNNTMYNNGLNFDTRTSGVPYPHNPNTNCEVLFGGSNVNFANNILYGSTTTAEQGRTLCWTSAYGYSEANVSVINNDFYNGSASNGISMQGTQNDAGNLASITAASAHNLLAVNPLLNNPTTDFHPLATSPVIGAGTAIPTGVLPGPVNNADGLSFTAPPVIGAFNAPSSVAGPVSISAGGPAAAPFIADAGFSGGTPAGPYTGAIDTSLVANPAPQSVYQNQRYGSSFNYVISSLTPGKTYQTVLHFTEDWNTAAGQRQENVTINGTQVLSAFDIFAATGAQHKAIAKSFNAAADANGNITISFAGTPGLADGNAKVDGIQVLLSSDWLLSANTPILYCSSVTLGHGCQQAVRTPNFTYWQPSSVAYPQVIRINLQALYNITRIAGTYNAPCLPDKVYVFTSTDLRKPWELAYTSISPSQSSFNVSFPNPQHINVQAGKFVAVMTDGFASGCFAMQTLQVYGH